METPNPVDVDGSDPPRIFMDPEDPKLVERLVEELKSQGVLDDIRKTCLSEVDTKVTICFGVRHWPTSVATLIFGHFLNFSIRS